MRSKIVDCATRLLHEGGPEAVTTRSVARSAGIQPPTIYRLFGDKDGLLEAVAEHVLSTYVSTKAAVVEAASAGGEDPLLDMYSGWRSQIDFGLANPTLFRLLSGPGRVASSPAARSGLTVLRARVHRIAETGRLRVSEDRAVGLIHAAGVGVVTTLLAVPADRRDSGLADEAFHAVMNRILADAPDHPIGDTMAAVVAFRAMVPALDMLSEPERQLMSEWLDRTVEFLETSPH